MPCDPITTNALSLLTWEMNECQRYLRALESVEGAESRRVRGALRAWLETSRTLQSTLFADVPPPSTRQGWC